MNDTLAADAASGHAAPAANVAPVAAAQRIDTLDFIRGIAVMGILWANIVAFGQPFEAYMYPAAFRTDPADPGGWMWITQFVLIDGKMRGLFTLLFGAGLYLFMEKAWARGATWRLQAWRLMILAAFGLFHFFFIWPGDILFFYAVFGFVALACIGWSAKAQLWTGLGGYSFGVLFYAIFLSIPWAVVDTPIGDNAPEQRAELIAEIDTAIAHGAIPSDAVAAGDYGGLIAHRLAEQWSEPLTNVLFFCFESIPLMLIGMALYRLGFFSGTFDRGKMIGWGWAGVIAGALAHLAIGLAVKEGGFTFYGTLAGFIAWSPLPRLPMVLGLAALMVVYAPAATSWLGKRIRAAGRAAFTNYLGTSILMMFVFHGWALGLFGELNRPQLYVVVVLAWVVMLAWSKPWLDRFNYGPLEWVWRCLTYGKMFPLKK